MGRVVYYIECPNSNNKNIDGQLFMAQMCPRFKSDETQKQLAADFQKYFDIGEALGLKIGWFSPHNNKFVRWSTYLLFKKWFKK